MHRQGNQYQGSCITLSYTLEYRELALNKHLMVTGTKLCTLCIFVRRSILRVLPIELACYTSEEEISRAIKPLVAQYFPLETQSPQKVRSFISLIISYLSVYGNDVVMFLQHAC